MRETVALCQQSTRSNGKAYKYWVLRWYGSDGSRHSQHIGRVGEMSKRQAEKRRKEKENELLEKPGRREISRSPALGEFLDRYYADRKIELAPGTLDLHRLTGRYLKAFFGEHRLLETIARVEARAFKTALGAGELDHLNKRQREKQKAATTVDQHLRHARKMFNHALDDDLITFNPFDRLAQNGTAQKDWHYVSLEEMAKLMEASRLPWRVLIALGRLAGLRLEEALMLPWTKIDWQNRRLTVISRDESSPEGGFTVKDKDARVVPICPRLFVILEAIHDGKTDHLVIPAGGVVYQNVWRDFQVIAKNAGVARYSKPLHSLRKSCLTDWAETFAAHVVKEWAGHADIRTTLEYYLKVSKSDYDKAAGLNEKELPKPTEADYERAANPPEPEPSPADPGATESKSE